MTDLQLGGPALVAVTLVMVDADDLGERLVTDRRPVVGFGVLRDREHPSLGVNGQHPEVDALAFEWNLGERFAPSGSLTAPYLLAAAHNQHVGDAAFVGICPAGGEDPTELLRVAQEFAYRVARGWDESGSQAQVEADVRALLNGWAKRENPASFGLAAAA